VTDGQEKTDRLHAYQLGLYSSALSA